MSQYKQMSAVPAGYESENDDDDDYYADYFMENVKTVKEVEQDPMEMKKKKLLLLVKEGSIDDLKEELDGGIRGFDIDEAVDGNWNLLFHACNLAQPEKVKFLIEDRGADVKKTFDSETPVMAACYSYRDSEDVLEVVKILVNESASISTANLLGRTPLMFAARQGHTSVVSYLLSLGDAFDAIDNDGSNALFHAIDGKNTEIAKILIEAGIDLNVTNRYGCCAKDYARNEDCEAILNLFPAEIEQYVAPASYLGYKEIEDLIPGMSEIPAYFPDVVTMLRGMNCERFIENFAKANVNLFEFLTMTEEKLEAIGIKYHFERSTILRGLHNFHKEPWTTDSLFIPKEFKDDLPDLDVLMMLANMLRQLIVIKSQIVFMEQLGNQFPIKKAYVHLSEELLTEFRGNIEKMKKVLGKKKVEKPLMIKPKKKHQKLVKKIIKISFFAIIPLLAIATFKVIKK